MMSQVHRPHTSLLQLLSVSRSNNKDADPTVARVVSYESVYAASTKCSGDFRSPTYPTKPAPNATLPTPPAPSSGEAGQANNKKDPRKPKRPLSAYNFFFKAERQNILEDNPVRPEGKPRRSHGKMGFATMARTIAAKWKAIDEVTLKYYEGLAKQDRMRYEREMHQYKKTKEEDHLPAMAVVEIPIVATSSATSPIAAPQMRHVGAVADGVPSLNIFDVESSHRFDPFEPISVFSAEHSHQRGVFSPSTEDGSADHDSWPQVVEPSPLAPAISCGSDDLVKDLDTDCVDVFVDFFRSQ